MPDVTLAQVSQPWRITARFASVFVGQDDVTRFTLRRSGTTLHPLASAWTREGAVVEVALEAPLLAGERYVLAHADSARTVDVAWHPPVTPPVALPLATLDGDVPDDPEAEAFGLDIDWLGGSLDARGDLPVARGLPAFKHDLAVLAVTHPGELVHRASAGLGLPSRVNGSATDATLDELAGEAAAAYLTDDRVSAAQVTFSRDPAGTVAMRTRVETPLLADPLTFTTRF